MKEYLPKVKKFFACEFRHMDVSKHSHRFWMARVHSVRLAMKLTETKRLKHRIFVSKRRNFVSIFTLNEYLTPFGRCETLTNKLIARVISAPGGEAV